jgi:sarcosine oxidase
MERFEVAVVGAGVVGLAAARALAASGRRPLVLEQLEIGTARAASHGASRIFRLSHDEAAEVAAARRALELWRALEREEGETLLELHGSIDAGRELDAHAAALGAEGVDFELVAAAEVERRFAVVLPGGSGALVQLEGGVVRADLALAALRRSAERNGAAIGERERVLRLEPGADGVVVETERRRLAAEGVVVAAGAWAQRLLRGAGIELHATPTRETVAYFRVDGPPVPSLIDWTVPGGYAFPHEPIAVYALHAPGLGLKVGVHHAGPVTDPEEEGKVDAEVVRLASGWVAERFPRADPDPAGAETCLYTSNPDLRPVIEAHGRVVVASACNGHGFKFAPAVGGEVARLAEGALAG